MPHEADTTTFGLAVVDPDRELVGREAAEHHGVHGAEPRSTRASRHRLRHHRHVDDDAIALGDAEPASAPAKRATVSRSRA
jgi:hypothetical protein